MNVIYRTEHEGYPECTSRAKPIAYWAGPTGDGRSTRRPLERR